MNNLGLSAFGSVETISKVGDIDLLVIDENDSLALVCEFKWTTGADSFDHLTGRVRSAITKAMDQLEKRLAWIESDPEKLADRVGIDRHLARKLEYKGLVIMFDTIGGGLFSDQPYPIIEARYLEFILGAPHNKSLRILWQVADKQRFLPIEKKHFVHLDRTIELDDMVLKLKGVDCCLTDEQWIADRDIDFKGLS